MSGSLDALGKASKGLLYPSESDEPIEVVSWKSAPAFSAKPLSEQSLDEFFGQLEASDDAGRFAALRRVIEHELADAKVYRVGEIRVDVFIVGRLPDGQWAGLHTVSIET